VAEQNSIGKMINQEWCH